MLVELEAGTCTPGAMGRVKGSDVARLGCEELIDLVGPAATLPYGAEGAIGDGVIEYAHREARHPRPPAARSRCSGPSSPSTTWACRARITPAARCSCSKAAPPRQRHNLNGPRPVPARRRARRAGASACLAAAGQHLAERHAPVRCCLSRQPLPAPGSRKIRTDAVFRRRCSRRRRAAAQRAVQAQQFIEHGGHACSSTSLAWNSPSRMNWVWNGMFTPSKTGTIFSVVTTCLSCWTARVPRRDPAVGDEPDGLVLPLLVQVVDGVLRGPGNRSCTPE